MIGTGGPSAGTGVVGNGGATDGTGVVGNGTGKGTGISGTSPSGTGVSGTSGSTKTNAAAVLGEITSTTPGGFSAGVRGINDGTGGDGIGVYGSHAGSGLGVRGTSVSGIGVKAEAGSGGIALDVAGMAKFSRSGHLNVPAGFIGLGIKGIHLTSSSLVIATVQNRSGVFVESAGPDPAHSRFTIFLNKVVPAGKTAKVAWFIVN